jgi:hypothetical protein
MKKRIAIVLGVALAAVGLSAAASSAPAKPGTLTVISGGISRMAFVSDTGKVSFHYPGGALVTGDRIFVTGEDFIGGKVAGFDNEACTVTFNGNDLCHDVVVLTGRGDIGLTYLLIDRNHSAAGPRRWSGIIDGTGEFQNVHGSFQAIVLENGAVKVTLPLG